ITSDLKLDNVMLDVQGHVRITDMGMCKQWQPHERQVASTFCGTPDYLAPEIIKSQHYNQGVDWWSFGVLLYELLIGQSPFNGYDEDELFYSICNEQPHYPRYLSAEAKGLLLLLLEKDPEKRIGLGGAAAGELQDHPFFRNINWTRLERKEIPPPDKPKLKNSWDVSYFDTDFTMERPHLTAIQKEILKTIDQHQFSGFSYINPEFRPVDSGMGAKLTQHLKSGQPVSSSPAKKTSTVFEPKKGALNKLNSPAKKSSPNNSAPGTPRSRPGTPTSSSNANDRKATKL
ncbi:unnamed protein product, partial [Cyprideis torosa]